LTGKEALIVLLHHMFCSHTVLYSQIKRDKTIIKKPWFGMINALFEYTDLVRKKLGHLHADGMDDATADQRLEELLQTQREAEARETELRDVLRTERQTRGDHQQHAQSKGEKLQRELARLQQQANARHQFVAGAADDETKAENERHTKTVQELQAEIAYVELVFTLNSRFCMDSIVTVLQGPSSLSRSIHSIELSVCVDSFMPISHLLDSIASECASSVA
jgi:hypothetical protein